MNGRLERKVVLDHELDIVSSCQSHRYFLRNRPQHRRRSLSIEEGQVIGRLSVWPILERHREHEFPKSDRSRNVRGRTTRYESIPAITEGTEV